MDNLWILAQVAGGVGSTTVTDENQTTTSTGSSGATPTGKPQQKTLDYNSLIFFGLLMVVMLVLMLRPQQKQKQERKKLEQSLEKNDKVVTIGGIIGIVVDLKDEEVTLKIDESNNTKIKVQRRAIGRNLSKEKT